MVRKCILFVLCLAVQFPKIIHAQEVVKTLKKNEVIVLGMIHSGHTASELYGLETLTNVIKNIQPDKILVEIPPGNYADAAHEFATADTITEYRVRVFPEYVDVVFPLSKSMDFEIIPTAGWSKKMALARRQKLKEISEDSARVEDWRTYEEAMSRADSAVRAGGAEDDPLWIHTDAYDEAVDLGFSVYNRLFNDELGPGGWDNINAAHYALIEEELDRSSYQGKRLLITYGSAHKGWFLRKLRERDDIVLLDPKSFFQKSGR